eukprot:GEMP01136656.1.p1 GENE.GEMP01136656.1~~GEMP01136656.1.p1  ORF type:complete len:105 (+),score=7.32 GEMP01136656.1:2-316(+)
MSRRPTPIRVVQTTNSPYRLAGDSEVALLIASHGTCAVGTRDVIVLSRGPPESMSRLQCRYRPGGPHCNAWESIARRITMEFFYIVILIIRRVASCTLIKVLGA